MGSRDNREETPSPGVSVLSAGKTIGLMQDKMGFDPVVGWLACVERGAPARGKSYTIRGGINSIRPAGTGWIS